MWTNFNQVPGVPIPYPPPIPQHVPVPQPPNLSYPYDVLNPYAEIIRLQQLLNANENRAISSEKYYLGKCKNLEVNLKDLGRTIEVLRSTKKKDNQEISKLQRQVKESKGKTSTSWNVIVRKQTNNNCEIKRLNDQKLKERDVEITRLKQEVETWKSRCSRSTYEAAANTILKLQSSVKESDEKIKKLEKSTGKKIREIGVCLREYDKLKETCRANLDKIADLERENERIRRHLRDQTSTFEQLLNAKDQKLETLITEKDKEIRSLKKSLSTGCGNNSDSDSDRLSDKISQLEKDLRHKQRKLEKLNTVAEDINKKYSLQNDQIYNLNSQNKFYKQKLDKLGDQLGKIDQILSQEMTPERKLGKLDEQVKLGQRTIKEDFIVSIDDLDSEEDQDDHDEEGPIVSRESEEEEELPDI